MGKLWHHPLDPEPSPEEARRLARRYRIGIVVFAMLTLLQAAVVLVPIVGRALGRDRVPIVPAGQTFTCTAISIWDGDGPIWCKEGPRIRLARINARELDGSCRRGSPCVEASGVAAREHLVQLLGGATGRTADGHVLIAPVPLTCRSDGWGKGDRTAAWCSLAGGDLSERMIADGFAARWNFSH